MKYYLVYVLFLNNSFELLGHIKAHEGSVNSSTIENKESSSIDKLAVYYSYENYEIGLKKYHIQLFHNLSILKVVIINAVCGS